MRHENPGITSLAVAGLAPRTKPAADQSVVGNERREALACADTDALSRLEGEGGPADPEPAASGCSPSRVFARRCVVGLQADIARCASNLKQSPALCTVLAPVIGYDRAASIARLADETGRPLREVALEMSGLGKAELEELLDPTKPTEPGLRGAR